MLRVRGSVIEEIRELPRGREVGPVLLEPEQVGAFYGGDHEQRELVRIDTVPRYLIDAILSVEDRRFESHHGIDPVRIFGAFLANLRAGGITQGGSTLTQQLVKNFFLTPERSYKRKATEAMMALLVEARYDKPEILQAYMNEIYLGQRGSTAIHGVGEAARFVFGKRVRDLTLGESALIAAIIQSPNRLSPHRNAEDARERRNLVLDLMRKQERVGEEEYANAIAEPLGVAAIATDPRRCSVLPRFVATSTARSLRLGEARSRRPAHLLDARSAHAARRRESAGERARAARSRLPEAEERRCLRSPAG